MKLNRRSLTIALPLSLLAASFTAGAQPAAAPKFGLLSFIGEELGLVGYQQTLGSRLDQNQKASTVITGAGFDATALGAMREQAQAASGGKSEALLYAIKSQKYANDPGLLIKGGQATLPAGFVQAMKEDGVTHVLLLTRRRNEGQMQAARQTVGSGKVEGVGYFADGVSEMRHEGTGFISRGYLSPYVSLMLSLIKLDSGEILAQRPIFESQVVADDGTHETGSPWRLIPDKEKITVLNTMIADGLKKAVPEILVAKRLAYSP